ncbi:cell wall protein DAN4 [Biomphalaria pfeifferi]|uniref:Cell wall protein DAN4 n=1 Tax=Biomphalaria pfeifferi TaxID=112525 RepID=A0AAD8B8Z3_BIOPF|nr:cell wall protein DAN4 [Biomphalaria pfeifferi]
MYFGPCVGHFTSLSCIVAICQVFGLQMTTVCGPKNATGLLQCMKGQWIQILSESYIPQMFGDVVDGSSCDFNFTSQCSSVRTDMEANCNGPCPDNGCQELVDVPGVQSQVPCLFSAHHVGVLVQYECIDDSTIIDMCTGEISLQMSYPTIYLSSPKFPNTIPQNTSCVCHIQGTRLTVSALQINAQTKLPWGLTEPYSSVLTVQNNDSFLWQSSNLCKNCASIHIQNENLYLSHATNYVNITITFSNFGLPHQLVWLQVSGQGQTMSATCSSSPLPPDRIITTTTTTTTTSTTTSATISMATSTTSSISSTTTSTYTTSTIGLSSVSSSTSTISSVPSTTSSSTSTISSVHLPSTSTYTKSSVPFTTSISTSTLFIASFSTSTTSPTTPPTTSTISAVHTTLAPQTTSMSTTLGMSETRQSELLASSTTSRPTATSASTTPPPTSAQPNSSTASDGVIGTSHTFESTSTSYIKSTTQDPAMITQNQPTLTTKDASSSLLAASSKRSDSQTLVIILVIILLVLLIIVIIVGVMVLRKRRKFTYNGKVGFKALFLSLYHQMTNRHPRERDPSKLDFHSGSFDSLELSGNHKAGSIPEEAIYTTELKNSESMGDNPYTNSLNTQIIPPDIKMNVHATCQEKPLLTCQQPSLETPVTQRSIDNSVEMSLKLNDDSTHEKETDEISTGKHDTPTSDTIKPDSQNNVICFHETCVNCDESTVPPLSPKVNIATQKQSVDDKTQETVSPSHSKTFIALNKVSQLVTDQSHYQLPTHDVNRMKELDRIEDNIREETESVKEYKRQKISKMKNKRTHNNIVDKQHASEDLHSAEFHQNDRSSFSTLDQPSIRVKQEEPLTENSHKSLFQPQEPPSSFYQVIDNDNKISSSSSDFMGQIIFSTDDKTKKKLKSRLKTGENQNPQSRSSTSSLPFSSSVHVTNNPNTLDDNTNSTKQTMSPVDITDSTPQLTPSYEDTDIIKVSHPEVKHKKTSKSQKVSDILQQSLDMIKQQRKQNEFVDKLNTSESKNLNSESQSFDSSQC